MVIPGRDGSVDARRILSEQLGCPLLVVHRLDRDTSGVLLFAKHSAAQRFLSHQFQNNTIEKQYLALVGGSPNSDAGEIEAPIGRHPTDPLRMAVTRHGGRPARTAWRLEQRFRHFSLLRVFPKTGKTHQIRVHLAHIGLPLAVDPLYGRGADALWLSRIKRDYRPKQTEKERPLIARLTLHAEQIAFSHPNGSRITLTAPIPKDLRATLNMLSKYDR